MAEEWSATHILRLWGDPARVVFICGDYVGYEYVNGTRHWDTVEVFNDMFERLP